MEKCPKCGYSNESFTDMMDRVIKKVSDRQRKEIGFGVPDKNEFKKHYKKEISSVITREWRQDDKEKDN